MDSASIIVFQWIIYQLLKTPEQTLVWPHNAEFALCHIATSKLITSIDTDPLRIKFICKIIKKYKANILQTWFYLGKP